SRAVVSTRAPKYGRALDARLNMRLSSRRREPSLGLLLLLFFFFLFLDLDGIFRLQTVAPFHDKLGLFDGEMVLWLLWILQAEDLHQVLYLVVDADFCRQPSGLLNRDLLV